MKPFVLSSSTTMSNNYISILEWCQKYVYDVHIQLTAKHIWIFKQDGLKHIKHKGKPLYFYHWIKSGIIYLNNILKDGQIDENIIRNKLKNHANWIMETLIVKQSIPKSWNFKAKLCTYE